MGKIISDEEMAKMESSNLAEAKQGSKRVISDEDMSKLEASNEIGPIEAGARGAASAGSLGFADEITGAVRAPFTGKPGESLGDTYTRERDESRANYDKAWKEQPVAYGTGYAAGTAAQMALLPATGIGKLAALGGTQALGTSEAKDLKGLAEDTAYGAAGSLVIPGASKLLKGRSEYLAKGLSGGKTSGKEILEEGILPNSVFRKAGSEAIAENQAQKTLDRSHLKDLYENAKELSVEEASKIKSEIVSKMTAKEKQAYTAAQAAAQKGEMDRFDQALTVLGALNPLGWAALAARMAEKTPVGIKIEHAISKILGTPIPTQLGARAAGATMGRENDDE